MPGRPPGRSFLRRRAVEALAGVGDPALGEWHQWTGKAYHIRRRLTLQEQLEVGQVVDVRGTPEYAERLAPFLHVLPPGYAE